jgi:hypothetical protein
VKNLCLLALVACSNSREQPHDRPAVVERAPVQADAASIDAPPTPIEHRAVCGDVTAIWRGERDEGFDVYTELWFQRGAAPQQKAPIELEGPDKEFDIFSPDCKNVLLLQSRNGPYHIVAASRLDAYLRGGKPDHVLAGEPDPEGITGTGVFHDGAWISNHEVVYQWGCCDPPIVTRFKLPK